MKDHRASLLGASLALVMTGCGSGTSSAGDGTGGTGATSSSGAPASGGGGTPVVGQGGTSGTTAVTAGGTTAVSSGGTSSGAAGATVVAGGAAGQPGSGGAPSNGGGTAGGAPAAGGSPSGGAGGTSGTAGTTSDPGPGANDLWIATNGDDGAPGTQAMPLRTLAAAVQRTKPGVTIWVNAGTYATAQTVALKANGQADSPLSIFAAAGTRPVFDFAAQTKGDGSARGLAISGDYWHLRGLDVINAGDNCINISGAHNTIENVVLHGCGDTGLQITANSSQASDASRAAYNTVLNCDSYDNFDAQNQGENADGFAAKLYIGPGNVFRGCRAWHNADDGWDLFASNDAVVIDGCWSIANAKLASGGNANGDGNGFKLGGAPAAGDANMGGAVHKVTNSVSIENKACGFVRNNNPDVPQLTMCGGRGDGKGTFCSLTGTADVTPTMSAADAIAAKRDANGNLPPAH